jgi:bifunctional non-homologous end joining protein LigD
MTPGRHRAAASGSEKLAPYQGKRDFEYLDFEGVIPSGQYGDGDVIMWDRGTWEPHGTGDAAAAVAAGEVHADVHGHKLRGPRSWCGAAATGQARAWLI